MYRIRWNRCSPTERAYLGAMARIIRDTQREEVTGREVADRVGREPKQLSAIRQRLIDKHVIESVDSVHATIRFTLPLYDRYVLQRAEPSTRTQRSRWIKPPRPGLDL